MTPGLQATDGFKNGAIGLSGRARFMMYGVQSGNTNLTIMVDGFQVIPNQNHYSSPGAGGLCRMTAAMCNGAAVV